MKRSNVAYQVMWNRLISVVEEQAQALVRTAFSTSVREAGDLSAGVYDVKGQMLAQASENTQTKKTPSHSKRKLFDHETEDFKIVDVVLRNSMSVGSTVDGPAIITEDETTVIVPANRKAISQSDGSIEMRLKVIQE